jgi:hypothetical protein
MEDSQMKFGTVARIQVKPGLRDEFLEFMSQQEEPDGMAGGGLVIYAMDNNPDEIYLAVVAPSREAYRANAESAEQHERYLAMMEWLAAPPEWHDGDVVFATMDI